MQNQNLSYSKKGFIQQCAPRVGLVEILSLWLVFITRVCSPPNIYVMISTNVVFMWTSEGFFLNLIFWHQNDQVGPSLSDTHSASPKTINIPLVLLLLAIQITSPHTNCIFCSSKRRRHKTRKPKLTRQSSI